MTLLQEQAKTLEGSKTKAAEEGDQVSQEVDNKAEVEQKAQEILVKQEEIKQLNQEMGSLITTFEIEERKQYENPPKRDDNMFYDEFQRLGLENGQLKLNGEGKHICYQNQYGFIFNAQYKNGKLDNFPYDPSTKAPIKVNSPHSNYYYQGGFKEGLRHGYGSIEIDEYRHLFKGEWQEGLPYRSEPPHSTDGDLPEGVVEIKNGMGGIIFRGTIKGNVVDGIYGEGKFFKASNDKIVNYNGTYRAPTVESLILGSQDIEFCDYDGLFDRIGRVRCIL